MDELLQDKLEYVRDLILESILDYIKQMFMMIGLNVFPKLEENNLINE